VQFSTNEQFFTGIQRDEIILSATQSMRADNTDTGKMPVELLKHLMPV